MNSAEYMSKNEYSNLVRELSQIIQSPNNTETVGKILEAINSLNPESFNIIMETKPLVDELLSDCVYYFDSYYDNKINDADGKKNQKNIQIIEHQYKKIINLVNQIIKQ
mgnify:CR=1 FL=1